MKKIYAASSGFFGYGVNKTLKELTCAINKLTTDVDKHEAEQSHEISKLKDKVHELSFKVENLLRKV